MLGLAACTPMTEQPPVPDSTFVEVMTELYLADTRRELFDTPDSLRDAILTHYGIDTTQYDAAQRFYADHPDQYLDLYNALLDRLNAERMMMPE